MNDATDPPQTGAIDRRSRSWKALVEVPEIKPPPDRETIDGIAFDYRGERLCKICGTPDAEDTANASEVHDLVDQMLVEAATYAAIARAIAPLTEDWPEKKRPSYHSIRRHQLRHLPADRAAVREIVERRAREAGLRIAVGDGPIVTRAAVLETVRNRGFDAIAQGSVTPTVAETMRAADALDALDRQTGAALTVEDIAHHLREFVRIVQGDVSEAKWKAMVEKMRAALSADPSQTGTEGNDAAGG